MLLATSALLLALTAPAERTQFVFALAGAQVGLVTLERSGSAFTYRSEQVFGEGRGRRRVRSATLPLLSGGRVPVSAWLWEHPAAGCVEAVEELSGRTAIACAERVSAGTVEGRAFGQAFAAHYRGGRLDALEIGPARFRRLQGAAHIHPADAWKRGFAVPPGTGALALHPTSSPLPPPSAVGSADAKAWALRLLAAWSGPAAGACLQTSRRFTEWAVRQRTRARLVSGLRLDGARAYPHAWVRLTAPDGEPVDLDPTWSELASPRTHLPFAVHARDAAALEVGALYLDLLSGTRRLVRVQADSNGMRDTFTPGSTPSSSRAARER